MNKFYKLLVTAAFSLVATQVSADSVTVGGDLVDRAEGDGWNDFSISFNDQVLPTGTITSWNTYIEKVSSGQDSSIALLVLRNTGGTTWTVVGSDKEEVEGVGLQTPFSANIDVIEGDILGVWMTNSKVSFDRTEEVANWNNEGNLQWSEAPSVGDTLNLNQGGSSHSWGYRTYSLQATIETGVTIGGDLVNRSTGDTWNNFTIGLTDQVLPTGTITTWNTFIEGFTGEQDTSISLLVLRNTGGTTWTVVGSDKENVVGSGLQTPFSANIEVIAGDILGLWMNDAKVSFDQTDENVYWDSYGNMQWEDAPIVGDSLDLDQGSSNHYMGQRTYSVQATVRPGS